MNGDVKVFKVSEMMQIDNLIPNIKSADARNSKVFIIADRFIVFRLQVGIRARPQSKPNETKYCAASCCTAMRHSLMRRVEHRLAPKNVLNILA